MQENNEGIDPRWFLTIVRRWWGFLAGFVLVAGIISIAATNFTPPVFSATATLLIDPARDASVSDYSVLIAGQQLAVTYSQMIKGTPVLQAVIAKLRLKATPDDLVKKIDVEAVSNTQLIRLTATDSSPAGAALLANTVAETFVAQIQELNTERYAGSLTSLKDRMDALSAQIKTSQADIDSLNAKRDNNDAEISRLQNLLSADRNDYQSLRQSSQSLQLIMTQIKGKVDILEPAHSDSQLPNTAITTFWVDQPASSGVSGFSTYRQMLESQPVLDATIAKLGLTTTSDHLAKQMTAQWIPSTQLIQLVVTDENGSQALLLAKTIAQIYVEQVNTLLAQPYSDQLASLQNQMDALSAQIDSRQSQIQSLTTENSQTQTDLATLSTQLAETHNDYRALQQEYEQLQQTLVGSTDSVVISEPAQSPEIKTWSRFAKNAAFAMLVAAILALALAFLFEYLNDTIKTSKDIRLALGLSTLGTIQRLPKGEKELITRSQTDSVFAEAFRMLCANLRFLGEKSPIKTLLVTSPVSSEGKSIVASNLAATFARNGLTVVAIDADLRIPRLHQIFRLRENQGLAGALRSGVLNGSLKPAKVANLRVLTGGGKVSNPAELIGSAEMGNLLEQLKKEADLIVIDSPPVLSVADATILASQVDGVLLVVRSGQTFRRAAYDAVESLRKIGANLVGVVINDVSERQDGYYGYYRYPYYKAKTSRDHRDTSPHSIAGVFKRNGKITVSTTQVKGLTTLLTQWIGRKG